MQALTIDPEFRDLLPPLTADERKRLEEQLLEDGCRDDIVVWANHDDTIIDGHHRYDLCEAHGIKFKTRAIKLAERSDVKKWILNHQGGRRNLDGLAWQLAWGAVYNDAKKEDQENLVPGGKSKNTEKSSVGHVDPPKNRTSERIAKEAGVAEKTIRRAGVVHEAFSKIAEKPAAIIKANKLKASPADLEKLAELTPGQQRNIVDTVAMGEAKTIHAALMELAPVEAEEPEAKPEPTTEDAMKEWNRQVESFARSITKILETAPTGGLWDETHNNLVSQQLKSAAQTARQAKGDNICPKCDGKGCGICKKTGFVRHATYVSHGGK